MSFDRADAPSEGVVVERLRTEATNWINAVSLQSGRIGRRFRKQYPEQVEVQALEVDLHFFVVAVVRLRRCIERTAKRVVGLDAPIGSRLRTFDEDVPWLLRVRNVSEHIDEYNLDEGRDGTISRRQVQTWYLDTAEDGGPIWGWLGERLDIEQTEKAALALYRSFLSDCEAWITARTDDSSAANPIQTPEA